MESVFDNAPLFLYSETELPPSGITQNDIELRWFANDTEKRFKKSPHPSLKPDDIRYRFNSKGYRCTEFTLPENPNTLKVVSIGASEVFGVGLPVANTFPQIFCDKLGQAYGRETMNWNLGVSGTSADYISRVLFSALPVLKPDIVLMVFPPLMRREYVSDTNRVFIYTDQIGSYKGIRKIAHRLYDPENSKQNAAHRVISSDNSDQINFFKNYQLCEAMCAKHDVMWLFSPFSESQIEHTRHLLNRDHLVLPGLLDLRNRSIENKDSAELSFARDLGHPGIKPNLETAELFFDQCERLYSARLAAN